MKTINRGNKWRREGSWKRVDPFTMIFVYKMNGDKFVLKGGVNDLRDFLDKNGNEPYVAFNTYFHHGKTRSHLSVHNLPYNMAAYYTRNQLVIYKDKEIILEVPMKRYPRKFPHQLKTILEG